MAQIQRKRRFEDSLELLNENGDVCYTIPVSLDIEKVYTEINKARNAAAEAETALKRENTPAALEAYGKAVYSLFASVFGKNGADNIFTHYENNYTEMLLDVLPYLLENVFPRLDALSSERLKQAVELRRVVDSKYGNRKHRR